MTVRGNQETAHLPADALDLVFLSDVYHHLERPEKMLASLRQALKSGGKLVLVEATPQEHRELGRISVFSDRTWNPPALAGGKAFVRTHREMACYDLTGQ